MEAESGPSVVYCSLGRSPFSSPPPFHSFEGACVRRSTSGKKAHHDRQGLKGRARYLLGRDELGVNTGTLFAVWIQTVRVGMQGSSRSESARV